MGTNTGLGIGIGIPFKNNALGGDKPYFPPELKARMIGVWTNYGKKNTDADRNIIKNKIPNAGGDLEILNAAYKLNSGFGKYSEDFTTWTKSSKITSVDSESFDFVTNVNWNVLYYKSNIGKDIPSFKVHIKLKGKGKVFYNYITSEGVFTNKAITSEEYVVPISYNTKYTGETPVNCGFSIGITSEECSGTITQIPSFEGAFVTDGVDDLITSTKTVQEMLGGSNELTIVSMVHQVKDSTNNVSFTNYIRGSANGYFRNIVNNYDKTGIYGYTSSDLKGLSVVNNILGDKNDYTSNGDNRDSIINGNFSVQGYSYNDGNNTGDFSSVAWYWTIIANKVLTTDQINQVIAYFNLDRTLKPDILCDVKKQGITNENHAEFNDKLIDFSGNGRDIQLNNIAWNKESGIDDDGALCLDGVNDFGKVTGMPIYKDYTSIIDYERISYSSSERWAASVVSKSYTANQGAFILMTANTEVEPIKQSYSFGGTTLINRDDFTRALLYQSKYKCGDVDLTVGEGVDTDTMWLGTIRDNDSRFFNGAIYSLMTFPYSMSKFLIERQLKKHKLGTLYPDMVEFRPVIKANANYKITYYQIDSTNTWKSIKVGDYIVIGAKLAFQITFDNDASELKEVVSPQLSGIIVEKRPSNLGYNIYSYITSKSPQKINITIDEYIRFEDIVQPYPVLLRFKDENGNEVSWGGKFRVGSTITRICSIADSESNLLNGLYSISGLSLNGKAVTSSTSIVEKQMVFRTTATWLLDNNEPKVILSPSRLRIPNSSYKILGYIPDISGHGNHGKINNSAYAEGSGVNEDGSYQFDGVDDFVTIPTLSNGGKQMLMKVNWNTINSIIYDQRGSGGFAIYCSDYNNPSDPIRVSAYRGRNANGTTYIDGIRNEYIIASQLRNVTHNIVEILDTSYATGNINPIIGKSYMNTNYGSLALYDFMLFDEISTDDKIQELNKYIGIEAKVELPPYYWDTYGKTNSDADRDTIQQRGIAVGDYDLTNYNHAYEGMSGYNGYPIILSGTNRTYQDKASYVNVVGDDKNVINLTRISFNTAAIFSYVKQNGELTSYNKDIESFKIKVTGIDYSRFVIKYSYISEANATAKTAMTIASDSIYELPKSFASDGSLTSSDIWVGINFTKQSNDIPDIIEDVNVTIEVLPEYENGLVYDGVEDFSDNKNIPIIDGFTVIAKRTWLEENISDKPFIIKGDTLYPDGNQNAFLFEYGKLSTYSFGQNNKYDESVVPSLISWATPTSYNGTTSLVRGSAIDTIGIDIAHATKMVFYKLILYPKTISLLEINFLKNLMEKDEIIDLTNPIFIKDE